MTSFEKVIFSLFAFGLIACSSEVSEAIVEKTNPNVILIVVDDLGYADMSCMNLAEDVSTPNLDALAASGLRFTNAYASSPICSPSRAGLITGVYQARFGIHWYGGPGIHDTIYPSLAEVLKAKNYETAYIGKVHYGAEDWDTLNRSFPLNHGFDYFFGHTSARKHYLNHSEQIEANFQKIKQEHQRKGQSLRQQALWENAQKVDTIGFSTAMFGAKARSFIRQKRDQAFFLQLSFNAVHNFTHQLPTEYLEAQQLEGYHDWNPAEEDYYEWYQKGRYPNNPEGRAQYLGQLHYLDIEIGKLLEELNTQGIRDNTLIVFIGDNGGSTPIYANNFPFRGSKYTLYEGGIRVPMLVSYPTQIPKGLTIENRVSTLDIVPSICRLTGNSISTKIDGLDISQLWLQTNENLKHDTLVWYTGMEAAVVAGPWKYRLAKSDGHAQYEMVELELGEFLYNLKEDPREQNNLAAEYPVQLKSMKSILEDWKKEMGIVE